MLNVVIYECNYLRDFFADIVSYGDKSSHYKLDLASKRSSISNGNKKPDCNFIEANYDDL